MEVRILRSDDLGSGIARKDKKIIFVKRAITGEVCDIDIIIEKKHHCVARISEVIKPSCHRIEPICPFYEDCGGCDFLHMEPIGEAKFKRHKIKHHTERVKEFYQSDKLHYRNKVTLHVEKGIMGFYQEFSRDLVSINYCYLVMEKMNEVIKLFDRNKDYKFNGDIVIRENTKENILVSIKGKYKHINKIKDSLLVDELVVDGNVIKGNGYLMEEVNGYQFKISHDSFFQINIAGLKNIANVLYNYIDGKKIKHALDLYSGTSTLGILISKYCKKITSIEENSSAANDALENIKLNKIKNLEVINGQVEDYIDKFKGIDLIIVDPARRGLDTKTIEYINKLNAKYFIYVSCDVMTLKRDLVSLKEVYEIKEVNIVDMFPRTYHIETIILFERKSITN